MIVVCKFCEKEFNYESKKVKRKYGLFYHKEFYVCMRCYCRELQPRSICLGCNRELVMVSKKKQLWLKKEENLKKHDKYDKEEFNEYLKKYNIERK